jgi:hypothetical protein
LFGRRRPPDDLERALRQYLEIQIREAQERAAAAQVAKRAAAVRAEVGRKILMLVLLVGYGLALGLASGTQVVNALLDPESLERTAQSAAAGGTAAVSAVPGALQGVLISALTTLALFLFRGTSTSLRSDLGGVLFVGAVVLSTVGLAAAAFTGTFGVLMAVPGLVAAVVVVAELCRMLIRLHSESATWAPARWSGAQIELWNRRLSPARHGLVAAVFVGLPAFCLVAVVGALFTSGGPLYAPAFASRFIALGWCLWAILVTPAAARIPLWSGLGWGALVVGQLSSYAASFLVVLAVGVLLYVDAVWLVLGARDARR